MLTPSLKLLKKVVLLTRFGGLIDSGVASDEERTRQIRWKGESVTMPSHIGLFLEPFHVDLHSQECK